MGGVRVREDLDPRRVDEFTPLLFSSAMCTLGTLKCGTMSSTP